MIIFSFSFKQETQEAAFAGNISIQEALGLLQQLAIADAVNKARQQEAESDKIEKKEEHE